MKLFVCAAFASSVLLATSGCSMVKREGPEDRYYLFSYFTGQADGAKLAVSTDGRSWQPLSGGRPVIQPAPGEVLRDPSIHRGPDAIYRMVWTTGWTGKEIGLSTSADLVVWTPTEKIQVMAAFPNSGHSWAPEIFYDKGAKQYIVYWSSDNDLWNIYYTTTKDFRAFTETTILFSNGQRGGGKSGNNGPIDAYIFEKRDNEFLLFYKKDDNTGVPTIYWRKGSSPLGPWGDEEGPIRPATGDEGPSVVHVGGKFAVFTDPFESDKAYLFTSKDLKHWDRETTNLVMSHGSVLEIDKATWRRLTDAR